jgi:putative flippase GtrA
MKELVRNSRDRLAEAWRERAVALKALSFGMVGLVNTAVDAGLFYVGHEWLGWPIIPANVAAWFIAVSGSYVMNSLTTFAPESGGELTFRSYLRFVTSGLAGVVANTTALVIAAQFLPVMAAKAIAILVSFVVNFSFAHFIVFRARPAPDAN